MSFYNNDATASNNTALNGIDIHGAANVSNFDNGLRELAAQTKQFLRDLGGANVVGGSADAIAILPAAADTVSAAFDGMMIGFEAASDNTSAVTANVGSIGAEPVKKAVDGVETALAAGDIQAGGLYVLRWRAGWDSGNGAWQLLGLSDALPASEDARGAVELATVAEAQARTDTARAVTPAWRVSPASPPAPIPATARHPRRLQEWGFGRSFSQFLSKVQMVRMRGHSGRATHLSPLTDRVSPPCLGLVHRRTNCWTTELSRTIVTVSR